MLARVAYDPGPCAGFVFVPRLHSAHHVAAVIEAAAEDGLARVREEELQALRLRDEVLA